MVLDIVESSSSGSESGGDETGAAAVIARIYGSHLHEDRSLPLSTVTLTDVHALHRAQSRYGALFFLLLYIVRVPISISIPPDNIFELGRKQTSAARPLVLAVKQTEISVNHRCA